MHFEVPSAEPCPEAITEDLLVYPDRIAEVFREKTVFITGGTGLLGKVLIDKLLRCCKDVKKIYLLVRPKKGKSGEDRIDELLKNPLYDLLKYDVNNNFRHKLVAIPGDISADQLAISKEDRQILIDEVDIVFHSAASVRFDEPFKKIVLMNVRGCKFMLELANKMKHLQLFMHVSTAYAHTREKVLEERAYAPPADPYNILKLIEMLPEDALNTVAPKLMVDYPNTYGFTKALAEGLVNDEIAKGNIPAVIVRPSVVIPIYRHPLPGWVDNLNGPAGLLIAAGKGVLRTMYMPKDTYADFVPVDVAVNAFCIIAHACLNNSDICKDLTVFNVTTSSLVKVSWEEIILLGRTIVCNKLPFNWIPWYPGGRITSNYYVHICSFYLKQILPAIIGDAILYCLRIRPVLLRVQKRIQKGYEVFSYYTNNQWEFRNDKLLSLRDALNPREFVTYILNDDNFDLDEYFTNAMIGSRRYILNEPDDTIPRAIRHTQMMYWVDKIFVFFLCYMCFCILYKFFSMFL